MHPLFPFTLLTIFSSANAKTVYATVTADVCPLEAVSSKNIAEDFTVFTTYCAEPTSFCVPNKCYTVTKATTLTITRSRDPCMSGTCVSLKTLENSNAVVQPSPSATIFTACDGGCLVSSSTASPTETQLIRDTGSSQAHPEPTDNIRTSATSVATPANTGSTLASDATFTSTVTRTTTSVVTMSIDYSSAITGATESESTGVTSQMANTRRTTSGSVKESRSVSSAVITSSEVIASPGTTSSMRSTTISGRSATTSASTTSKSTSTTSKSTSTTSKSTSTTSTTSTITSSSSFTITSKVITTSTKFPPVQPTGIAEVVLKFHNQVRAIHQAPPLVWDQKLVDFALGHLETHLPMCQFEHSGGPYGENLALGYPSTLAAMQGWYNENSDYDYENPGFSINTGHFTQMVWAATTSIGCAKAKCPNGLDYLVCEYSPPGNMAGWFPKNVLPPTKSR